MAIPINVLNVQYDGTTFVWIQFSCLGAPASPKSERFDRSDLDQNDSRGLQATALPAASLATAVIADIIVPVAV